MTLAPKSPSGEPMAAIPPPVARPGAAPGAPRRRHRADWSGYLFLLPYLVLFVAFLLLPLLFGLWLSVMRYELLDPELPGFVGLSNYRDALGDPHFRQALGATLRFVVMASPLTILLALLLALGLDALPERRQNLYRLGIFLPTIITISVAGILWRWFYSAEFGVFNALLARVHASLPDWLARHWDPKVPWITSTAWAMPSIVLMTLWWTVGGPLVVLLAGLRQIPNVYYEAAAIDGAIGFKRLAHITLPLLKPVLLFVVVLNVIGAFQIFGQPYIITRGGPERSTLVLVMYIYESAFLNYHLGYGAAMSWILFLIIAVFSVIQFRVMRER